MAEHLDYEVDQLCDFGVEPDELRCFNALIGHPDIERIDELRRAYEDDGSFLVHQESMSARLQRVEMPV